MRYLMILLFAGGVLAPLAGCGSESPDQTPSAPAGSAGSTVPPAAPPPSTGGTPGTPPPTEATTPEEPAGTTPATPPGTTPPKNPPGTTPPGPGDPPGPGELPGGLPHGERTVTGVVERTGDCTTLRVGARRWGLAGTIAEKLTAGDRVTVVGQVTTADPACAGSDVLRTLIVSHAS